MKSRLVAEKFPVKAKEKNKEWYWCTLKAKKGEENSRLEIRRQITERMKAKRKVKYKVFFSSSYWSYWEIKETTEIFILQVTK